MEWNKGIGQYQQNDCAISHTDNYYIRDDQKALSPLYFALAGNANLTFIFNIIFLKAMHLAHLCLSFPIPSE